MTEVQSKILTSFTGAAWERGSLLSIFLSGTRPNLIEQLFDEGLE
jgi:hypothetical protein